MRESRVWQAMLGVPGLVVESVDLEDDERVVGGRVVVVSVRVRFGARGQCARCGVRCAGYDQGRGRRRWRSLDHGVMKVFLEADAPRVRCGEHGVVVAQVPWARPGAKHTRGFEDMVAWLVAHAPASTVAAVLRVAWRTVTAVVDRVVREASGRVDLLEGVTRIGIDEIAYRKGHRYLVCVIDHDTGRLIWARPGRNAATIEAFFTEMGPDRAKRLTHVSADGADWIHAPVAAHAPQAVLCLDPFHVIMWVNDALDQVRRDLWNRLRRAGHHARAANLKGTRWALVKNPVDLTLTQKQTLADLRAINSPLYTAYLIKEQLRNVFRLKGRDGRRYLIGAISWAAHSHQPALVRLAATLRRHLPLITNTLDHGLSNARCEATNTHLRALTKRANGYHTPHALISMAMLTRSGLCPPLPTQITVTNTK